MPKFINLAGHSLDCQNVVMKSKTKEPRTELLGVMVTGAAKEYVREVADHSDRSLSYIGGLFLMRGLAAHKQDGRLKEPEIKGEEAIEVGELEHGIGDDITERRLRRLSKKKPDGSGVAKHAKRR